MPLGEAIRLAQSKGLDLIEIAPNATPPVCRIMEYGKFMYEESKRRKESNSRQSANKMKELQLTPGIDPHDFAVKLSHAIEFLCEDMKVRIKLRFRGRQRAHKEFGFAMVNKFVKEAAAYGQADAPPAIAARRMTNSETKRPNGGKPTAANNPAMRIAPVAGARRSAPATPAIALVP